MFNIDRSNHESHENHITHHKWNYIFHNHLFIISSYFPMIRYIFLLLDERCLHKFHDFFKVSRALQIIWKKFTYHTYRKLYFEYERQ